MGSEWEWKARGLDATGESVVASGSCAQFNDVLAAIGEASVLWKSFNSYSVTKVGLDGGVDDGTVIARNLVHAVRGLRVMAEVPMKRRRHVKETIAKHIIAAAEGIDKAPSLGLEACAVTLRDAATTWLGTDDVDTVGRYRNKDLCNYVRGVLSVVRVTIGEECHSPWEN